MLFINIPLVLLALLILSDLYLKYSPRSDLVLIPLDYKIKKKDNLNEIRIDFKIVNKSKFKETMVSNLNLELDFFKSKGCEYFKNMDYEEDIYIYNG